MEKNYKLGLLYSLSACMLWGFLPIYWKQLQHVHAFEILASRFLWSALFVFFLLVVSRKLTTFINETKFIFSNWKRAICMLVAASIITFNWGIFIWAVEAGRIIETSMGYYINPLVSVLFGMVFLHERLGKLQIAAVICAVIGIGTLIINNGGLPWISVSLAITFALYGLLKKILPVQALTSIMLETLLISPLMAYYLYYLSYNGGNAYQSADVHTLIFLCCSGIATATPLLLFTASARLLPLNVLGFMQYISPSLSLLLGVFVYNEAFTFAYAIAFGWIWFGLILFSWSQIRK